VPLKAKMALLEKQLKVLLLLGVPRHASTLGW
jgi:hypothetical protein